jgi:hypothetical protein
MIKVILIPLVALSLGGCFAGVETRSGWHMVSLPPSSGKRLTAQCTLSQGFSRPSRSTVELIEELRVKQDNSYKNLIRELEMENAALRAANKHLMDLDYGRK